MRALDRSLPATLASLAMICILLVSESGHSSEWTAAEWREVSYWADRLSRADDDVRGEAIYRLSRGLPSEDWIIATLLQFNRGEGGRQVMMGAAEAAGLKPSKDSRVILALIKVWPSWGSDVALGRIGAAAGPTLLEAVRHSNGGLWAGMGLALLGAYGDSDGIPFLLEVLGDPDRYGRSYAAMGLGNLGVASPEVLEALREGLDDPKAKVRIDCALALTQLGVREEAVEAVIANALEVDHSEYVCGSILSFREYSRLSDQVASALRSCLGEGSECLRVLAAAKLSMCGDAEPAWLQIIAEGLASSDEEVFRWATWTLTALGERAAGAREVVLRAMRAERSGRDALECAEVLDAIGGVEGEGLAAVRQLFSSKDGKVRLGAAMVDWRNAGDLESIRNVVCEELGSREWRRRLAAVEAIGAMGAAAEAFADELASRGRDKVGFVREAATTILSRLTLQEERD